MNEKKTENTHTHTHTNVNNLSVMAVQMLLTKHRLYWVR